MSVGMNRREVRIHMMRALRESARRFYCMALLLCVLLSAITFAYAESSEETTVPQDVLNAGLRVSGEQLSTGPILSVTQYQIINGSATVGADFTLRLRIDNLSDEDDAYNVLATLNIENTSVSVKYGETNQRYFDRIQAGSYVYYDIDMKVYSYCTEENMILSVDMACYDEEAVHYDFMTSLTPPVQLNRSLVVSSLSIPQYAQMNAGMVINASLYNPEPVTLTNVEMHVVTAYDEQVIPVGDLLSEENATVDAVCRFSKQNSEQISVYFTYESYAGDQYQTQPLEKLVLIYDPTAEVRNTADSSLRLSNLVTRPIISGLPVHIPAGLFILLGLVAYVWIFIRVIRKKGA